MSDPEVFVGVDVGGTNIKAVAFSSTGEVLSDTGMPTADDGTKAWLDRTRPKLLDLLAGYAKPVTLGVAAPGLPAQDGRSIAHMPGRLAGIEGLDWQEWLGLERPVQVLNDAQAALLGEVWLGAAKGS